MITADSDSFIFSLSLGVGIGTEQLGIAGSATTQSLTTDVQAYIATGANVFTDQNLLIDADDSSTIIQVGGAEGVGVAFLDETFSASTSAPHHRVHEKAAQSVLEALLPEQGTEIRGNMKSYHELLERSGYARRPKEFERLMRILDNELRLLTPADLNDEQDGPSSTDNEQRYYQPQ